MPVLPDPPTTSTAIAQHGEISSQAKEAYGEGETILRIGNGGAGATGLLRALSLDYLSSRGASRGSREGSIPTGSIAWVCNHSRNTLLALHAGHIDIALTYERDQAALASREGWAITVGPGCVFHDRFVLAGPVGDPAGVRDAKDVREAVRRIREKMKRWWSRGDGSATMVKEREIWTAALAEAAEAGEGGLKPWEDDVAKGKGGWYQMSLDSPAEALKEADRAGAYILTDRSTLLRQTWLGEIHNTTVFFEPLDERDGLMNSCYVSYPSRRSPGVWKRAVETMRFVGYLFSERGQRVIASYGREEVGGFELFTGYKEGCAKRRLRGGRPVGGKWRMDREAKL
jgi:tungstate transport system substrate-binding protein